MPASRSKSTAKKQEETTTKKSDLPEVIEMRDAKISLHPSKRKTIRKIKLILSGTLNITNVDQARSSLLPVFENFDYLDFQLKEVSSLDLSFIQLLYHFKYSFAQKGKNVTIDSELTGESRKIIVHAGFEELMFIPKLV